MYRFMAGILVGLTLLVLGKIVDINATPRLSHHLQGDSDSSVELLTWGKDTMILKGRNDIYLSHYPPQHSVVVLIVNDIPWTESDLRNMSGSFTVHAPGGQGLMAVVQVLSLRRDLVGECTDFIQFYDPHMAIGSLEICGRLSKENKEYYPGGILGQRVFQSSSGMTQVHYKSDKGAEAEEDGDVSFHMVEIVFTAYTDCYSVVNAEEFRRCGDKCISSIVTCDERINCGFEEDFALDEMNCGGDEGPLKRGSFLVSLYLGGAFFVLILALVALYHHHYAYRRIKNIPHM